MSEKSETHTGTSSIPETITLEPNLVLTPSLTRAYITESGRVYHATFSLTNTYKKGDQGNYQLEKLIFLGYR